MPYYGERGIYPAIFFYISSNYWLLANHQSHWHFHITEADFKMTLNTQPGWQEITLKNSKGLQQFYMSLVLSR